MNMSQANKGIIDIRGKSYRTVAFRVNEFRTTKDYDGWCINTDIIQQSEVECTMKCIVTDQNGAIRGTGIANEVKGAGNINKTSHIENCETSAIGRALASIGLAGEEYASADELVTALVQQEEVIQPPKGPSEFEQASKYLFDAAGYVIGKPPTGTVVAVEAAMKFLKKKYDAPVINKIQAFADGLIAKIKTMSQEKANAEAA
tara:strand:- start:1047 stop:1655 length:609 start_codon:yes stop_codon:yes gene_type:complete